MSLLLTSPAYLLAIPALLRSGDGASWLVRPWRSCSSASST